MIAQEQKLLSIIIPVYKTEAFLEKCVQSVLSQTYTNIEVLIIDDGSGPACKEIVERMQSADCRLRYYRQDNRGLLFARKKGIELSRGAFITHLDSDDWISEDVYRRSIEVLTRNDSKMVIFNLNVVDDAGDVVVSDTNKQENFVNENGAYFLEKILGAGGADWSWHLSHNKLWDAAFLKDTLDGVPDQHLVMCEDLLLSIYYFSMLESEEVCSSINDTNGLYYYKHAAASTVKKDDINRILKNIRDLLKVKQFALSLDNSAYLKQNRQLVLSTFRRIGKLNYPPFSLFRMSPYGFVHAYILQLIYVDAFGPFEKLMKKIRA